MSNQLQKTDAGTVEFVPFGAADKIKLNISIAQNLCAVRTKTGKTCSTQDALKFIAMCQAQRLNPFAGDAYLVGYDTKDGLAKFSLITAHVALLKRAETCTDYEGMESGIVVKLEDDKILERESCFILPGEELVGGWARVHRKGRKPTYSKLSLAQRKPAYPTPFWEGAKAAEQMQKCAESDALRSTFPTLLGGLYHDAEIIQVDSRPATELPASRLVDVVRPAEPERSVETEPAPGPDRPTQQGEGESVTPQAELAAFVTEIGHSFTTFQKWAADSGNIEDAGSLGSFDEISAKDAMRLLRAKVGLKDALHKHTIKPLKGLDAASGGEA